MDAKYISIEEAAHRAGSEKFYQNVKNAIIPRLIEKGILHGKRDGDRQLVADDDALARIMQLGVEAFVDNQQGYSFVVVRAPIEQVSEKLKSRPGVAEYQENVKLLKMKKDLQVQPDETLRQTFLVQMRASPQWSALFQTVHWFQSCDAIMATAVASALSKELNTLAAAAWDDDFSGSSLIVCENGEQSKTVSDEDEESGGEGFYEFFYEQGIYLPESFISSDDKGANLHVSDPAAVQRADRIVLKVPSEVESTGPHVFEKLGMMAEAMAEELHDEEAFLAHMRGNIWNRAQAMLAAGEI